MTKRNSQRESIGDTHGSTDIASNSRAEGTRVSKSKRGATSGVKIVTSKKIQAKRDMDEKKLRKIIEGRSTEHYVDLVGWLYKNHLKVLREYEATKGNLRIQFAGGSK